MNVPGVEVVNTPLPVAEVSPGEQTCHGCGLSSNDSKHLANTHKAVVIAGGFGLLGIFALVALSGPVGRR